MLSTNIESWNQQTFKKKVFDILATQEGRVELMNAPMNPLDFVWPFEEMETKILYLVKRH